MAGGMADALRALGRYLDEEGATGVEIVDRETYLAVSWDKRAAGSESEQRSYVEQELEDLRAQAREMRQGGQGNPAGSLAELLRTLGQELDERDVDVNMIAQERDGFLVTGIAEGRYFRQMFETSELLAAADRRRIERGQTEAPASS
jgi:hypothetical protein